ERHTSTTSGVGSDQRRGIMRVSTALLLLIGIGACSNPIAPEGSLPGTWSTGRMSLGHGSWEMRLILTPDGEFTQHVTNYGAYPGQSAQEPSSEVIISGTYAVDGSRLEMLPSAAQRWDLFDPEPGPHPTDAPSSLYPDCT